MGMGEPLLNGRNVVEAVRFINRTVGIGARNITISTVGVPGQLERLAQEQLQCVLAVSLHAPNQELRCAPTERRFYTAFLARPGCMSFVVGLCERVGSHELGRMSMSGCLL